MTIRTTLATTLALCAILASRCSKANDGAVTGPWIDKSAITVIDTHTEWIKGRWSKAQVILLTQENDLLRQGTPANAWQYEKLSHFADTMQTCSVLAVTVEGMTALATDNDNKVIALASVLGAYRKSIRVRIDEVRNGLRTAQTSSLEDVRQSARELLKMVDEFDKDLITPRVRELEMLERKIGKPPGA